MLPHVYTSVENALSVGEGISPAAVYPRADGSVTVLAFVIQKYGNTPLLIHVYPDGTQSTEILPTPKDSYVPYVYTMTPEDMVYYTLICETTSVRIYADGMNAVLIPDIAALFGEETVGVSYIAVDADGNCCLATETQIAVTDPAGNLLFMLKNYSRISALHTGTDGQIYVQYTAAQGGNRLDRIDPAAKSSVPLAAPDGIGLSNVQYYAESADAYYMDNGAYLYHCTVQENGTVSAEPLCSWVNSDIIHSCIRHMSICEADAFTVLYTDQGNAARVSLLHLTRQDPGEAVPKYVITLAVQNADDMLVRNVVAYNRRNAAYRIRIRDYGTYNTNADPDAGESALQMDMAGGDIPDIVILSTFSHKEDYISQNIFTDFYTLMDGDADFSREMLLSCVQQPFERDGYLYELVSRFSLRTMVIRGERDTWTLEEFLDEMRSLSDTEAMLAYTTPQSTLTKLLSAALPEFVDTEKAQCSFDSALFTDVLIFARDMGSVNFWKTEAGAKYHSDRDAAYRDGAVRVNETDLLSLYGYVSLCAEYSFADISVIGYPCDAGCGSIVTPTVSWGICESSPFQEAAWAFVKEMLGMTPPPSREQNYDMAALRDLFSAENTGVRGVGSSYVFAPGGTAVLIEDEGTYEHDPAKGTLYTITEADLKAFTDILEHASAQPVYYDTVMKIITEEAAVFFAGDRTAEKTAQIIQNRCALYISEKFG